VRRIVLAALIVVSLDSFSGDPDEHRVVLEGTKLETGCTTIA
jgi:hypothetical protein